MSMSTYVVGFRPPDAKWERMKAAWDACQAAHVAVPKEVGEFFDWSEPDEAGVKVQLEDSSKKKLGCVKPYQADMQDGFEVDVTKLPKDVTIIRFYNSY